MKQIILFAIVFMLLLTPVFALSNQPEVLVYPQPDSPVQLSSVVSKWRKSTDNAGLEWNMLTIEFSSQNVSDKAIRAYSIRHFSGEFDKDVGSVQFSFTLKDSGTFNLNHPSNEQIGEQGFLKPPESIKLAVDFVEFTDGRVWGKDISNSAEQSSGVKAGIKTALERLKETSRQSGIEAAIKTLDEIKELLLPDDKSVTWKRGFKGGVNNARHHIKRAYEKAGIKGAENELQKLFDISFK